MFGEGMGHPPLSAMERIQLTQKIGLQYTLIFQFAPVFLCPFVSRGWWEW